MKKFVGNCNTLLIMLVLSLGYCLISPSKAAAEPYLGEIRMFAGTFAPKGWALCNGQLLPIAQNTALFSLLGTIYGGNGSTNFALPDLRGRFPMHAGNGYGLTPRNVGEQGGGESVNLSQAQLPSHSHAASATVKASSSEGNSATPVNNYMAKSGDGRPDFSSTAPAEQMASGMINISVSPAGNGSPVSTISPYTTINFIIALQGVYPSQP